MLPEALSFPSKIQIQTINVCNYACPMCPYPEVAEGSGRAEFDLNLFRRMIDEIRAARRKVKLCIMLQNEPFLDRRFIDFLDYAHDAEDAITSISTVTNGSVLNHDLLDRLSRYERFYLTISVNATDGERYKQIHGRDFWERIYKLLTGWDGARDKVRLSFVLDSGSVGEGKKFQSFWHQQGYQTRFVPINSRVNSVPLTALVHKFDMDYGHCHYPVDTLNVLVDGSVILCCNDWQHTQRFGNLNNNSISEIWNGPELMKFRAAALEGNLREFAMCRDCDYPVRSAERMRLEALVSGKSTPGTAMPSQRQIVAHPVLIRYEGHDSSIPVLVYDIDERNGDIFALTLQRPETSGKQIGFEFRIGHSGAFSFGSLDPVWCPGEIVDFDNAIESNDTFAIRIRLDSLSPEFRFFPWYCADWRRARAKDKKTGIQFEASLSPPS